MLSRKCTAATHLLHIVASLLVRPPARQGMHLAAAYGWLTPLFYATVPLIYRLSETEPFSQFGFVVPSDALARAY